jgi:hypothetical protein
MTQLPKWAVDSFTNINELPFAVVPQDVASKKNVQLQLALIKLRPLGMIPVAARLLREREAIVAFICVASSATYIIRAHISHIRRGRATVIAWVCCRSESWRVV